MSIPMLLVAVLLPSQATAQFWKDGFWSTKATQPTPSRYMDTRPTSRFDEPQKVYPRYGHEPQQAGAPSQALSSPLSTEDHQRLASWEVKASASPCWRSAVASFRSKCGKGAATDGERSLMAMSLMNCQLETDGRGTHKCAVSIDDAEPQSVQACIGSLKDGLYPIYIQFRIHLDTLCFYVGEEIARERMERASRDLHMAADLAGMAVSQMERKASEMEHRMEHTSIAILKRFDSQLEAAQEQVVSIATLATHMAEQHEESLAASVAYQQSIRAAFNESTVQLDGQRGILQNILHSASNLTLHTQEQHQRMSLSSSEILTVLDRVYVMQRSISDSFSLLQMAGVYLMAVAAVIIATLPARSHAARPWSLIILAGASYLEYWHIQGQFEAAAHFLLVLSTTTGMGWLLPTEASLIFSPELELLISHPDAVDIIAKLWRRFVFLVIISVFALAIKAYESSDARLHRIVHEAIARVVEATPPKPLSVSPIAVSPVKRVRGGKTSV